MALQKSINSSFGSSTTPLSANYARIVADGELQLQCEIYYDANARSSGCRPLEKFSISCPDLDISETALKVDGKSELVIKYDHLKTLDSVSINGATYDFTTATDV